ncbi:MAG: hypothetical protein ABI234_07280 [Ktedonobacteraceae bacterium]
MYQWWNSDTSWQELQVGDRVQVKGLGEDGHLIEISAIGDYVVQFDSGFICGYDADILIKVDV